MLPPGTCLGKEKRPQGNIHNVTYLRKRLELSAATHYMSRKNEMVSASTGYRGGKER